MMLGIQALQTYNKMDDCFLELGFSRLVYEYVIKVTHLGEHVTLIILISQWGYQ
jgi:hypothetical protein